MAAAARIDLDALPESEVVVLAQRGDLDARELLAVRYRLPAFRLAMQLLGRPEEAKDVAQDAMLRFFTSLDRFQPERPVLPWLFRIVHNRVRDLQRQRRPPPCRLTRQLSRGHGVRAGLWPSRARGADPAATAAAENLAGAGLAVAETPGDPDPQGISRSGLCRYRLGSGDSQGHRDVASARGSPQPA